jgi:hypothetical protein
LNVSVAVVQQYFIPSVVNSLIPFASMDLSLATERLLKVRSYIYRRERERGVSSACQFLRGARLDPTRMLVVSERFFFFSIFFCRATVC